MAHLKTQMDQPVIEVARKDFTELRPEFTVREALNYIRSQQVGEKIVCFFVVGDDGRLVGVLPTRRLLAASPDLTIPQKATVLDAFEFFIMHKFLAFPVVDEQRRMVGLVDVSIFTEEVFDYARREKWDEVFETIGFHLEQVQNASPLRAFRFRFPWYNFYFSPEWGRWKISGFVSLIEL